MALASRGYVVAAPTHPRGKDKDISGPGVWVGRPKQVSRVIDAVLEDAQLGSHIQRDRIGVVGHSNGGYTALAVAGAKPSTGAIIAHCRQHPDDSRFCSFGGAATRTTPPGRSAIFRTSVILACARSCSWRRMRPAFTDDALAKVAVPGPCMRCRRDDLTSCGITPSAWREALPPGTEYVPGQTGRAFLLRIASFPGR